MNEISRAELAAPFPFTHVRTINGKRSTTPLYRSRRCALLERLGGRCTCCGGMEGLQFHHVNQRREGSLPGGWAMIYRIERELEAGVEIVLMCRDCHELHHANQENDEP